MLSTADLQRVSAERAAAVLVLCDKFSLDPSEMKNIMIHNKDTIIKNFSKRRFFKHYESYFSEELQ